MAATSAIIASLQDAATDHSWAQQLADELLALSSIYDEEAITLLPIGRRVDPPSHSDQEARNLARSWRPGHRLRLQLRTPLEASVNSDVNDEPIDILTSITLPERYPDTNHPPQVQLLNRFVGGHSVDHVLFGKILRCFLHDPTLLSEKGRSIGLEWRRGDPILFEALEWAKESVQEWYEERQKLLHDRTVEMDAAKEARHAIVANQGLSTKVGGSGGVTQFGGLEDTHAPVTMTVEQLKFLATELKLVSSEPIIDRKSSFIGHCCRISSSEQVPLILDYIRLDKRIARAAHPTIHAWVCTRSDGIVLKDCDDDGETAAGSRLAHLLDILVRKSSVMNWAIFFLFHIFSSFFRCPAEARSRLGHRYSLLWRHSPWPGSFQVDQSSGARCARTGRNSSIELNALVLYIRP